MTVAVVPIPDVSVLSFRAVGMRAGAASLLARCFVSRSRVSEASGVFGSRLFTILPNPRFLD
jgi:hypothetical protein